MRAHRFGTGLIASYGALASGVIYSLASIPLVLRHVPLAEFGMWTLALQLAGYWMYLDCGISLGLVRLLVDAKNDRSDGRYDSLFRTAGTVSFAAALGIVLGCLASGHVVSRMMDVEGGHVRLFALLYGAAGLTLAVRMLERPYGAALLAHQKMALLAWAEVVNMALTLGLLWIGLRLGWGIASLPMAMLGGALWVLAYSAWQARVQGVLPQRRAVAWIAIPALKDLWVLGRELLCFGLGTQFKSTVASLAVGRWLGLESVAVWSVCSKAFTLIQQFTGKFFDVAVYPLMDIWATHQTALARARLEQIVLAAAAMGGFFAWNWAILNSWFVQLWTQGSVRWEGVNDLLLAACVAVSTVHRCFTSFCGVTKVFSGVRWVPWIEGGCAWILAWKMAPTLGVAGILGGVFVANVLCEGLAGGLYLESVPGLGGFFRRVLHRSYGMLIACAITAATLFYFGVALARLPAWSVVVPAMAISLACIWCLFPRDLRDEFMRLIRSRRWLSWSV